MIKRLAALANKLDNVGAHAEADILTKLAAEAAHPKIRPDVVPVVEDTDEAWEEALSGLQGAPTPDSSNQKELYAQFTTAINALKTLSRTLLYEINRDEAAAQVFDALHLTRSAFSKIYRQPKL